MIGKTYTVIALFGKKKSHGTFDDIFDMNYKSVEEAWAANDYVHVDFVEDQEGVIYLEAHHVQFPAVRKYHRLEIQKCFFGIDMFDDEAGCQMAGSLFKPRT